MTQEFHISVTPVGNGEYLVRTEQVAPGVPLAEEQVFWAVEDWLEQARQLMTDPLVGMLQGDNVERVKGGLGTESDRGSPLTLQDLGKRLYSKLFQGTLRDSWVIAQGIAQHRKEVLRLRLGLKGTSLLQLPWEVMAEGDRDLHGAGIRTIATGTDVLFSRYQPGISLRPERDRLQATGTHHPLRILMVIATPRDSDQLALTTEAEQLQHELKQPIEAATSAHALANIELTILRQPGREQLTQALEQGRYQVLHYAGHSNLGEAGGDLYLVNERTGLTELLSGDDLAGLLVNNGIQMAVFNSCRGGYTAALDRTRSRDRNLAEALVSRGIPAVLAMAERIPDDVALVLTRLFYRNLKLGYPVDLSLSRARQGLISSYGSHQLYWALPTLYLHPDFDGYLYGGDRTITNPADRLLHSTDWMTELESLKGRASLVESVQDTEELDLDDDLGDESWEQVETVASLVRQLEDEIPVSTDTVAVVMGTAVHSPSEPSSTEAVASSRPAIAPPSKSSTSKSNPGQQKTPKRHRTAWIGAAGLLAIALLGGLWWRFPQVMNGMWTVDIPGLAMEPSPSPDPRSISQVDWDTENPKAVTQLAIRLFNQGDMLTAQDAVESLLNRGAMDEAKTALEAVPIESQNDATVHFLRGRLLWNGIQSGDSAVRVADARQEWQKAAQLRPSEPNYWIALGFAYYAEDQPYDAIQSWLKALDIFESQSTPLQTSATAADPAMAAIAPANTPALSPDLQNLYGGIAIGFFALSKQQPPEQQTFLREKAIAINQSIAQPPFDPAQSDLQWLWSMPALEQWRALQKMN